MRQSRAQQPPRSAVLRAGTLLTAAALVLAACTDPDDAGPQAVEPEPEVAAAEALAAALSSGDFSAAPLSEEDRALATEETEEVLGEVTAVLEPAVEVTWSSSTYEEGEGSAADAALTWTWDVPGSEDDWSYPVSVHLVATDDGPYLTEWSRDLLAPDLGEEGVLTVTQGSAPRGQVLGQDEEVLVTETDIYRIGIDKTYIPRADWEDQAIELAETLELDDPEAYADRVLSAGDRAFLVAMEVRQDDPGDVDMDAVRAVEGVNLVPAVRQLGPTPGFATEILGRVGEATAEIIEDSDGAVQQGDQVGLSGLQRAYDEQLRGFGALTVSMTTSEDAEPTEVFTAEAVRGQPLRTTLDSGLQVLAEQILADQDSPSALVAIRPSTGEVLAAASGPASEGWSTATLAQYPPGSTFKVITLLALLRSGMELDDAVSCTATLDVNGREFENYPGYPEGSLGEITLEQAVAQSCNTALMDQRDQVSAADLASAAEALGLGRGDEADLGFPLFLGSLPEQAEGTQLAAEMIGQGQVLASPLAMATVAASIAAEQRVTPQLLVPDADDGAAQGDESAAPGQEGQDEQTGSDSPEATEGEEAAEEAAEGEEATDGEETSEGEEASEGEETTDGGDPDTADDAADDSEVAAPLTHTEATLLQQVMRAVVTDGTGTGLRDVPGDDVLAKTGTAEGAEDATHGWMIAIQGDLAVAGFVGDGGRGGAATAGPLVEELLSESGS